MAERHISLPKPFSSGDVKDWFQRFEICARANGWEVGTKAKKLPTLLEGEALAVWLELTNEEQEDYAEAKKAMEKAMMPMTFVSLDDFHRRKLRPGEALSLYVHDLRKLLTHALPNMEQAAKEPLLVHQFLAGIPDAIAKQLRASGEVTTLDTAITRARLLMTIDSDSVATLTKTPNTLTEKPDEMRLLREQVAVLTDQVAALATNQSRSTRPPRKHLRCFYCNQVGHLQRDCRNRKCFNCGRLGHLSKECWHQGNDNGALVQGNKRPYQ